ncbi:MAG: hypothetical protein KTR31_34785 [Myxococcales bacterium]|nr:hypothetical protein [Myxococcales bacterium]
MDDELGRMYLCGGEQDRDQHHHWFDLQESDGGWSGNSEDGTLTVALDGDAATGLQGSVGGLSAPLTFEATPATDPGGPWEPAEATSCEVGVVVFGDPPEVQGLALCDVALAAQVVPIGVVDAGVDRFEVRVSDGDPFEVVPAGPR